MAELVVGSRQSSRVLGVLGFVCGIVAIAGVVMVALTTYLQDFNPAGWIRIGSMAPIPFVLIGAVGFGIAGMRSRGRAWAIAGILLAVLALGAFLVVILTVDY